MLLKAEHIDAFVWSDVAYRRCDFKKCTRAGKVRILYKVNERDHSQSSAVACPKHAFDYANNILGKYKFGHD